MDDARHGRLDEVPAHRGVDDRADLGAVYAAALNHLTRSEGRRVARGRVAVPHSPGDNSRQALEQARSETESLERRKQPGLKLGGGDTVRGVDGGDVDDGDVIECMEPRGARARVRRGE